MKIYKVLSIFIPALIALTIYVYISENSICRNINCMRAHFNVGDEICYYTSASYPLSLPPKQIGGLASNYFSIKNIVFPIRHTVVSNKNKVIGLVDEGSLFPFIKNKSEKSDGCSFIE